MIKKAMKAVWKAFKPHGVEYCLLILLLVYGELYFSWGVFRDPSYGFSDLYVHHSWIYQLSQGNVFSAGIYPEGMHCVVYALHTLFGIRIYSALLFLGTVTVVLTLLAAYCFMKELFQWRYTPLLVMVLFLTLHIGVGALLVGMARMQCSLPQEYGFPFIFLCALYLVRYMKSEKKKDFWDENLLIFTLALAATIIIHFYATFMAFFLCLGIAAVGLRQIFRKTHFLPLVTAVLCGVLIAAAPMAVGFATGIPLQGSLNWGMNIIKGESEEEIETEIQTEVETETQTEPSAGIQEKPSEPLEESETKQQGRIKLLVDRLAGMCKSIYIYSYEKLFGREVAIGLVVISIGCAITTALWRLFAWLCACIEHKKEDGCTRMDSYLMLVLSFFIFMVFSSPRELGLPMLVETSRMGFIIQLLMLNLVVIPADVLFAKLGNIAYRRLWCFFSVVLITVMPVLVYVSGNYHSYLYYELTRYPQTVNIVNSIIKELPDYSYTLISPTDELYQVIEHGRHEELLTFLENQSKKSYTLPTEYVFMLVEKRAFQYAQYHFFDGPEWLAWNRYQEIYKTYSTCPQISYLEISKEDAKKEIMQFTKRSLTYTQVESRQILESKAYVWCEKFKKLYPNELKIYYEDDEVVCYYWKQNPRFLYNLVIE